MESPTDLLPNRNEVREIRELLKKHESLFKVTKQSFSISGKKASRILTLVEQHCLQSGLLKPLFQNTFWGWVASENAKYFASVGNRPIKFCV